MKVIFIAFANSQKNPLEHLSHEDKQLMEALSHRYIAGDYLIHRESFATIDTLLYYLNLYKNNLAVFHFSGHAGQGMLATTNGLFHGDGLAAILGHAVNAGVLKLVVLNGCSTFHQVNALKSSGVPIIISTTAPVNDRSAANFSVRLWRQLLAGDRIDNAFEDAIKDAGATQPQAIGLKKRHLFTDEDIVDDGDPLWRIDYGNANFLAKNPVPVRPVMGNVASPNSRLTATLFEAFARAGNDEIKKIRDNELTTPVQEARKQTAIVNNIPFPIGIQLQKLICPTVGSEDEGYDSFGLKRLEQITQTFHTTIEFLGIIMISQLWETCLKFQSSFHLSKALKDKLNEYLYLDETLREYYDYKSLIDEATKYLNNYDTTDHEIVAFLQRQSILQDLTFGGDVFDVAYNYLSHLRAQVINKTTVQDQDMVVKSCAEAELQLGIFLSQVAFIHSYQLTSVQSIDILKLRHIEKQKTEYKHKVITCMQAIGKNSQNYYYIESFLDNWGVGLLKSDITPKRPLERKYNAVISDYINLSPFIIDRNAFIDKADLAFIMFYKRTGPDEITFKSVVKPFSDEEDFTVATEENPDDRFDSIRLQFNAFTLFIQ